jgi:hypothetical protein
MHIFLVVLYFIFNFSKHGAEKEIKIVILNVDHLHSGLGHSRVAPSMSLNKFCGQCNSNFQLIHKAQMKE